MRTEFGSADETGGVRSYVWLLPAFVAPFIIYFPVLIAEYGFSESYRLLAYYHTGQALRPLMIAEGRPVQAIWSLLMFGELQGAIAGLARIRFVNLCTLGIGAALVAVTWHREGFRRSESACAGALFSTLPAFQLFSATAAMGFATLSATIAAAAIVVAPMKPGEDNRRSGVRRIAIAMTLAVLAVATYQSGALAFFALGAIPLFALPLPRAEFRRRLSIVAGIGIVVMASGFGLFQIGKGIYPGELVGTARGLVEFAPLRKLSWFLGLPLSHATHLWVLRPVFALVPFLLLFLSIGISARLRGSEDVWLRLATAFMVLPLCYLPNLVVSENHSSFRSQTALITYVLVCDLLIVASMFDGKRRRIRIAVLALLLAIGGGIANRNVSRLIVTPQARELAIVREELGRLPDAYTTIGVRASSFRDAIAPAVYYDEFGFPSTGLPWSFGELTWLVLREQRAAAAMAATRLVDVNGSAEKTRVFARTSMPPDTIIDWGVILRAKRDADPVRR